MTEKDNLEENETEILEPEEPAIEAGQDTASVTSEQLSPENAAKPARKSANAGKAGIAIASLVVVALAAGGIGYAISSASGAQASADRNAAAQQQAQTEAAATAKSQDDATKAVEDANKATEQRVSALESHSHSWEPVYELQRVAAKTHTVHHDAEYGTEVKDETMCNACQAVVTGKTAEHTAQTGHTGFTTNVPVTYDVVTRAAYDETVTDQAAKDELVLTGYKCSSCGAEKDADGNITKQGTIA